MLRQGMIERFRKAAPIIRELVDDLAWIQNEFNPENATYATTLFYAAN